MPANWFFANLENERLDRIEAKLDRLSSWGNAPPWALKLHQLMERILERENRIMATLKDVQDAVTAQTTVIGGAKTLLEGLKAQLDAAIASGDPAAIQAISDSLGANTQTLADAVAANTPTP